MTTSLQTITGPVHKKWNKFLRHFEYAKENEYLVTQNLSFLRNQDNVFIKNDDTIYTKIISDTNAYGNKIVKRMYDYFSAHVIYNSTRNKHNYIIIDKGSLDGVQRDMAVLSAQGVVGVVNEVSKNFSSIIPLLNPNSRTSAKIKPINQIGTVVWEDNDPEMGYLVDIPQHLSVKIGDSIFTSGYSNVFPADILIGTVAKKEDNAKNTFLTIKVKYATNFNNINTVYLVSNLYKTEIDSLKQNFKNE
ncbi:MAG TPA: rod shape-determining protein MreC [Bacteroidales bacterium]|nr:rod shape-determining protein MreC [Bacteroidales bacterium]